jgi:hypothetical protein
LPWSSNKALTVPLSDTFRVYATVDSDVKIDDAAPVSPKVNNDGLTSVL